MNIEITGSALEFAQKTAATDLKKIIKAIKKGDHDEFYDRCRVCFEKYLAGEMDQAKWWSNHADLARLKR